MGHVSFNSISITRFYTVSGMEPVPDSARCPLDPTEAEVLFQSDRLVDLPRAVVVRIGGKRLRGEKTKGTYSRGYYSVLPDGTVVPDDKTGPAPAWVQEIVTRAIAEHTAYLT